ncbi:7575_t:CDS:2 [Acaulospora morrowiae]|uniref:7575_t:CDS:1 n=1 Tax=Acaulospora morrowiae TaxID=94023 RepID=A0A9N9CAT6_9GLOM|nr:7575_t:CDS:2 [Acaulospora morrowiae]
MNASKVVTKTSKQNQRKKLRRYAEFRKQAVMTTNERITSNNEDIDTLVPEIFYQPEKTGLGADFTLPYQAYFTFIRWVVIDKLLLSPLARREITRRHRNQPKTRKMTTEEIRNYILLEWISEDFLPSDLKPSNLRHSSIYTDPRFTFQEKFLEKRCQRLVVREMLNQKLLPPNSVKPGTFTLNLNTLSSDYLNIVSDVIQKNLYEGEFNDNKKSLPPQSIQQILTSSEIPTNFMELLESEVFNRTSLDTEYPTLQKNPLALVESPMEKLLWKNFALWGCFVIAQDKSLERYIHETFLRHPSDKLYIAKESTTTVARGTNLKGYQHIFNPQCIVNTFGETIVDLFNFYNQIVIENVRMVVDQYYQHTLTHPSHQSKQFAKDLIEHFGSFADSNNLPYTTANTASSHCEEHQKCVRNLLQGLQPISGAVNKYLKTTYPILYSKMEKLDLGSNFGSLFADYDLDWDSNEDEPLPKYLPPTLGSGDEVKLKNHRRMNVDLERARKGLPARYKK